VSYSGTKSWRLITYKNGKPRIETIGRYPTLDVKSALKKAKSFNTETASARAEAGLFPAVAEDWIELYVNSKGLRSKREIVRQLKTYVYPAWARKKFWDIRRSTVNDLLNDISRKNGKSQADGVLATLRSMMNWYAKTQDDYNSPIVKGMNRDLREPIERARHRILNDEEIRLVWNAASAMNTPYGGMVKLLLLTAQRREKVATMKRSDIVDSVWKITTEKREKGNPGSLKLPPIALEIIRSQPIIDNSPYVFPGERRHKGLPAFNSFSLRKRELSEKLPRNMEPWTVHDLRRTARSLMSRAGVERSLAERVLGHAIGGIEATYDRYDYFKEKGEALDKLAKLLDVIVNPPDRSNVVPIRA